MAKINQQLLNALAKKTGLKQRQAYNLVSKASLDLMLPRNLAALVVASQKGININKFASQEDLATIRQARTTYTPTSSIETSSTSKSLPRNPKLDGGFADPFVDAGVISSAHRNAELYPVVYVFENSVRNVVSMVMQTAFGEDWWEQKVKDKMKQDVAIRQSDERQHPWHSQRGAAPICYTDISDLRTIINTYNKTFKKAFGKITQVELWIAEIEKTRNILAHNNPVSKKDRDRLTVFARDWSELAKKVFNEVC